MSGTALASCFEEAEDSGILKLCGKRLQKWPTNTQEYSLQDVTVLDLSNNKLAAIPKEICSLVSIEILDLYRNIISIVPTEIRQLHLLRQLNLSRNQIQSLPEEMDQLPLENLDVSNNRLQSLPSSIGSIATLKELNAGNNEIKSLPDSICQLSHLKVLDVCRNHLSELPADLGKLQLTSLDFSANAVTSIPPLFGCCTSLVKFAYESNPISWPPAQVCARGKAHIFKYLQDVLANREQPKESNGGEGLIEDDGLVLTDQSKIDKDGGEKLKIEEAERAERKRAEQEEEEKQLRRDAELEKSRHAEAEAIAKAEAEAEEEKRQKLEEEEHEKRKMAEEESERKREIERKRAAEKEEEEKKREADKKREAAAAAAVAEEEKKREADKKREAAAAAAEEEKKREADRKKAAEEEAMQLSLQKEKERESIANARKAEVEERKRKLEEEEQKQRIKDEAKSTVGTSSVALHRRKIEGDDSYPQRRNSNTSDAERERLREERERQERHRQRDHEKEEEERQKKIAELERRRVDDEKRKKEDEERKRKEREVEEERRRKAALDAEEERKRRKEEADEEEFRKKREERRFSLRKSDSNASLSSSGLPPLSPNAATRPSSIDELPEIVTASVKPSSGASIGRSESLRLKSSTSLGAISGSSISTMPVLDDSTKFDIIMNEVQLLADMNGMLKKTPGVRLRKEARMLNGGVYTLRRGAARIFQIMKDFYDTQQTMEKWLDEPIPCSGAPDELPDVLADGIYLCKLANKLNPGVIAHVAEKDAKQTALSLLRSRKNVEAFLLACHASGMNEQDICSATEILDPKDGLKVLRCIQSLLSRYAAHTTSV